MTGGLTLGGCPAYVLAGGKSNRFGSDKARVEIDGRLQLVRLIDQLTSAGHQVHVVADRERRYADLGLTCIEDVALSAGPLAGVAAALEHRQKTYGFGWLLLVSCDQLLWRRPWSEQLMSNAGQGSQAIFFSSEIQGESQRLQPIPALYHTSVSTVARQRLEDQQLGRVSRSLRALLEVVNSKCISTSENPRNWSFNTPAELQRVLENGLRDNINREPTNG